MFRVRLNLSGTYGIAEQATRTGGYLVRTDDGRAFYAWRSDFTIVGGW